MLVLRGLDRGRGGATRKLFGLMGDPMPEEELPLCELVPAGTPCVPGMPDPTPTSTQPTTHFSKAQLFQTVRPQMTASIAITPNPPIVVPGIPQNVTNAITGAGKPWWQTWWGIGLIVGAGYFGYKKFIA